MTLNRSEIAEVVAGAVVLTVAVWFLIYAGGIVGWFGNGSDLARYRVSLMSAQGVQVGTDVRVSGVRVGRVDWMTLNPQTFDAETELTVDAGYDFPQDSLAVVSSEGLLGGKFVEIIPGQSTAMMASGGKFRTATSEMSLVDLLLDALNGNGRR